MSKKHKHDLETRVQIVKEYQSGQISLIQIGKKYGLRGETVRRMVKRYETGGALHLRQLFYFSGRVTVIFNSLSFSICA